MTGPATKRTIHEDLFEIPENMTGEIIHGELFVTPRPPGNISTRARYWVSRLFLLTNSAGAAVQVGGSSSSSPRWRSGKTFLCRTWLLGRRSSSLSRSLTTGFLLHPSGFVKSCRPGQCPIRRSGDLAPFVRLRGARCKRESHRVGS